MKTLEELAAVDTTTITEMLPRVISKAVELKAREILLGRELLKRNTDILVPKPGKSVFLPMRSQIAAQEFAEGADMSAATPEGVTYADTVEVTPTKFGVPLKVTQEAIDAAQHDVMLLGYIWSTLVAVVPLLPATSSLLLAPRTSLDSKRSQQFPNHDDYTKDCRDYLRLPVPKEPGSGQGGSPLYGVNGLGCPLNFLLLVFLRLAVGR